LAERKINEFSSIFKMCEAEASRGYFSVNLWNYDRSYYLLTTEHIRRLEDLGYKVNHRELIGGERCYEISWG
jgi:hypothetical protein